VETPCRSLIPGKKMLTLVIAIEKVRETPALDSFAAVWRNSSLRQHDPSG
jgi:hypothetical protein